MAQRLVRTLCPHCKKPAEPPDDETWRAITAPWRADKPAQVMGAGRLPRMPDDRLPRAHRALRDHADDAGVRRLVTHDADDRAIREQAYKDGMKPLRVSGAMKVAAGITTADEVVKVAPLA